MTGFLPLVWILKIQCNVQLQNGTGTPQGYYLIQQRRCYITSSSGSGEVTPKFYNEKMVLYRAAAAAIPEPVAISGHDAAIPERVAISGHDATTPSLAHRRGSRRAQTRRSRSSRPVTLGAAAG